MSCSHVSLLISIFLFDILHISSGFMQINIVCVPHICTPLAMTLVSSSLRGHIVTSTSLNVRQATVLANDMCLCCMYIIGRGSETWAWAKRCSLSRKMIHIASVCLCILIAVLPDLTGCLPRWMRLETDTTRLRNDYKQRAVGSVSINTTPRSNVLTRSSSSLN